MNERLLPGVRVLDIGQRISGPYCAKVLANLGAEVIKVEPPQGDESRTIGPFPGDIPHPEKSGTFLALNANKFGVTLDLDTDGGLSRLLEMAATVDLVIDNRPAGNTETPRPDYEALRHSNPEIILTSITPFGGRGPYAGYKTSDLVLFHMTGHANALLGPVKEPDNDPPIRAGGNQAELVAGLAGAAASVMALYRKRRSGVGCHINVSSYEAMVTQLISGLANAAYGQSPPSRSLASQEEASIGGIVAAVGGVLPCSDGYVAISPREDAQWDRWVEIMEHPDWASEERFATREGRQKNFTALWPLVGRWTRNQSKYDVARRGQEHRIPCFPVNTVEDLLIDTHLEDREFFVSIDHPAAGPLKYPGVAYKLSNTTLPLTARPAPLLGEHNGLILRGQSRSTDG